MKYPRDLAVAIAALTLAVATSIAIGLMVDSFRQDFARMLDYGATIDTRSLPHCVPVRAC